MKKIKFAIIGPGKISHSFLKGIQHLDNAEAIAVVSRDKNRAIEFAKENNLIYAYDNVDECLANNEIDAVYISTPPFMHFENAMAAMKKGKHVLCEKPFTVNIQELEELIQYARKHQLMLMEAMKSPFLPLNQEVKSLLDQGEIGEIRCIDGSFTYDGGLRKDHFHFKKHSGGGSLYDVGVYPLAISMYFVNSEVKQVAGFAQNHPGYADSLASLLLQFENGVIANVRGGLEINTYQGVFVYGKNGKVSIPHFWTGDAAVFDYYDGREQKVLHNVAKDEFQYEIGHFVNCILNHKVESDIMTHEFSLKMMKIMYPLVEQWEKEGK